MGFITKEELKTVGQISLIDKIINDDNSIVNTIIDESVSTLKSYLSRRYDVDVIFAATGSERHKGVLKRLKDIVIYEVYDRMGREASSSILRAYNEAINWLEKLNTGEFYDKTLPPIPTVDPEDGKLSEGDVRFGGNLRYTGGY